MIPSAQPFYALRVLPVGVGVNGTAVFFCHKYCLGHFGFITGVISDEWSCTCGKDVRYSADCSFGLFDYRSYR